MMRKDQKKAYACAKVMEKFHRVKYRFCIPENDGVEYYKWFPHYFEQLLIHDPQTCELCEIL